MQIKLFIRQKVSVAFEGCYRRTMMRARYKRNSLLVWLLVLIAFAIILVRLAMVQQNPAISFFKKDSLNEFDIHSGLKPTMCSPVKEGDLVPPEAGVNYGQPIRQKKHVMYTSVPKCGSRSLIWIMWEILGHFNSSDIQDFEYRLDDSIVEKERTFLNNLLSQTSRPTFFHGHQRFVDFEGEEGPIYISVIREPIARYVSWYYFMRHGDSDMNNTQQLQNMLGRNAALPNETIDDCFKNKRADCTTDYHFMLNVVMFCGYHKKCSQDRAFALTEAKKNLDKYLFVGIMEDFDGMVRVLEKLMPSFFGGGVVIYRKIKAESVSISKTKFKAAPSQETVALMRTKMKEDIEFYEYAKQKFLDLKDALKIGTTGNC
ncbi:heparan sulfate 2-O-sulfotransferase hst-2-like isoform X2 [Apostichopus japonicus]|uniref:heparan sulfate 2-O-sulfotransferase hst-2-like isoform X2 n=1 Tax=Stichopus japonicus TaxID=307972 RepID=UPI003AB52B33